MSRILRMATVIGMLAFAVTGVAQARPINYRHDHFRAGYAGAVYSQAPRELWPWYVPQLGVQGLACDMPTSTCSNDERIND